MIIAPSILSADFGNLQKSIGLVRSAEWLHIDVMDGHFVPNITIGPVVIKGLRKYSKQVFDTHLMISNPNQYIKAFIDAGSDRITFHIEAVESPIETIEMIRNLGAKVGISIKPSTSVETIEPYLSMIDQVLVMSVEPGFGGQQFMMNSVIKIEKIRELSNSLNPKLLIVVDGGINELTCTFCAKAGADVLVAGSYVFNSDNPEQKMETLR